MTNTSAYYEATQLSDEILRDRQREISAAQDAGEISTGEAADLRCEAMESHLAACAQARMEHLGGAA